MKVKIENKIYDSTKQPILIVLDNAEKKQISEMGHQYKYCSFPETGFTEQQIKDFMVMEDT